MSSGGQTIVLGGDRSRSEARRLVDLAPPGFVVTVREPKRTTEQSDKMWAMLGDISRALPMDRRHTPDDWKALAMNACGWECQFIEGLDGRPFPQGFRSSNLTKPQMSVLIDWLQAFGDEHGVLWTGPASGIAAGTDETRNAAQPEGREPGPKASPKDSPTFAIEDEVR